MPPTEVPVLTDGRVTLRSLDERDVQGCYEQCVEPLSVEWTRVPVPFSLNDARNLFLRHSPAVWADGSVWIFAVEAEGRYDGNIALRDEGHGRAEVAYGCSHPAARGSGIIEAGLRLLMEWGFADRGLETIIWRANVGNWGSRKLAWRLGFTVDGILRQSHVFRGELTDAWIGTLRSDEPHEPSGRGLVAPVFAAGDVRLRPLRETDIPRIVEACSDPRTTRWLPRTPQPYDEQEARAWIEETVGGAAPGTNVDWAFDELDLKVLRAHSALDNDASRHVLESAGFGFGGVVPLGTRTSAGDVDAAVYYLRR